MREILLTSSVLILAVLLLRLAFRDRISRRAQYALWGLVLLRLLVPVSLPGVDFSVLSAAEPVGQAVAERLEQREVYLLPQETVPVTILPTDLPEAVIPSTSYQPEDGWPVVVDSGAGAIVPDAGGETATRYAWAPTAAELLTILWLAGVAGMAVWFLVTNLRFWRKLRRTRTPYAAEGCRYPVYLVAEGLPSPCLFGFLRPAIYLTPAAVASPERLGHVLAHETAHARHGDPLWSLLRCVCLAVYWFDPLVWAAAAVSKTDGELACDESAIRALGEDQRIPYGRTLLSLIPVRKGPGAPLLSATTMTAGKRQLKDRITRIARGNQTRAAALFLALALVAGVCAVTFTGAKAESDPVPLTGDELAYFNEEFFNNDTVDNVVGLNIHNQFLTSLYERPEDIDLFELFYCGTGIDEPMSDAELQQVGSFDTEGGLICPVDKMSVEAIDQVLLENTGLTLDETEGIGLEYFQYLPEYDAYYHSHGDTNYFSDVQIAAGERAGSTIRLYYEDTFHVDGWKCVTLEAQDDGSYWFVSNLPSEKPAIPTVYPEGDPVLTIPLTDLTPYEPEAVEVTRHTGDCAERGGGYGVDSEDGGQVSVYIYRSTDGNLYAAEIVDMEIGQGGRVDVWNVDCFFTFPEHNTLSYNDAGGYAVSVDFFKDLFGHNGLVLHYSGELDEHTSVTFHDYYYFDSNRDPVLLARVHGTEPAILDLDGDGTNELLSDGDGISGGAQLVFQRDEQLYEANLTDLLQAAWPEMAWWDNSTVDTSRRCLTIVGMVQDPEGGTPYHFTRYLYFDGENILVYQDNTTYTDHVADNIDVPEAVLSAAKDAVLSALDYWRSHTGAMAYVDSQWQQTGTQAEWDDWRITELVLTDTVPAYPELGLRVYGLRYELHTTTPENVMLAGGMYMDEDGWVGGLNTLPPVLVFHTMANSGPVLLQSSIPNDVGRSSDNPMFAGLMAQVALENGLLTPSEVRPVDLYYMFYNGQDVFLNLIGAFPVDEQNAALDAMAEYAVSVANTDDGGLLADGLQRLEESDYGLTEEGEMAESRLRNAWTRAQAEAERQSLLAGQAQGDGTVYTAGGLSLWVPAGWADMAVVTARDSVWSGESVPGFDVYERLAHDADPYTGRVWDVRALTRTQFQSAFGDADWSEILGASSYVIGSDDAYIYLLSTPTDVQFLVEDPTSMAQYELLRDQSQAVLEDFLSRNGITPNPDCPDADGCYVGSASADPSPARPTEADIQAAILNHRVNATAHQYNFSTEAHRVLDTVQDGSVCTVYLLVWYSAYERTATGWQSGTNGQFPAAVTFSWQNGGWEVTDYQEPASYATDLRAIFPEELADMVVNDDEAWAALQEECRAKAEAYFAEHPVSASLLQSSSAPSEEALHAAILHYQSSILPMDSDGCAEAHQVLQETSGQDTHTFHLFVYCTSFLEEDGFPVQDWYSLFPASITFRYENGSWQPVGSWGFYGSDTFDRPDLFPDFPTETLDLYVKDGVQTDLFKELHAELRAECLQSAEAEFA
mgnify:CR=1 FL=1